jgi:imidazole glycerol phosphate synthase subunit HisF
MKMRLVEIGDSDGLERRIAELKHANPAVVVAVRINLDARGVERSMELAGKPYIEALHLVADAGGNELNADRPRFIKDMLRQVHTTLVQRGIRNEVTLIAGGGIALAEHMAKQIICGADLVSVNLPLLIAMECTLCRQCNDGLACRAGIRDIDKDYGVGRMVNLIAAWHDQLIEVMGAMGIRDVRRLRGEAGRALFFEELEEASFGKLFGKRINS